MNFNQLPCPLAQTAACQTRTTILGWKFYLVSDLLKWVWSLPVRRLGSRRRPPLHIGLLRPPEPASRPRPGPGEAVSSWEGASTHTASFQVKLQISPASPVDPVPGANRLLPPARFPACLPGPGCWHLLYRDSQEGQLVYVTRLLPLVPCLSVLVLNSLSEQLDDHMGLYGVGDMFP